LYAIKIELDNDSMHLKLIFPENIIYYYRINSCEKKLRKFVKEFGRSFVRMNNYAMVCK